MAHYEIRPAWGENETSLLICDTCDAIVSGGVCVNPECSEAEPECVICRTHTPTAELLAGDPEHPEDRICRDCAAEIAAETEEACAA